MQHSALTYEKDLQCSGVHSPSEEVCHAKHRHINTTCRMNTEVVYSVPCRCVVTGGKDSVQKVRHTPAGGIVEIGMHP